MKNWHRILRVSVVLIVISLLQLVSPSHAIAMDGDPPNPEYCVAQWEVTLDQGLACGCSVGYVVAGHNSADCQDPCSYTGSLTKICPGPLVTTVTVEIPLDCGASDGLELICPGGSGPYLKARFYCDPCI